MRVVVWKVCVFLGLLGMICRPHGYSASGQSPAERARFEAALDLPDSGERTAALEKFLADFPDTSLKEAARVQIISALLDPDARIAAMKKFVAEFPQGEFRDLVYTQLLEAMARQNPPGNAAIEKYLKEFVAGTDTVPPGHLAEVYNASIQILLRNDVLPKNAEALIDKALGSVAQQTPRPERMRLLINLGKILYVRKDFPKALTALQQAREAAGADPPAELFLMLGRVYQELGNDQDALDALINAGVRRGDRQTKAELQAAYEKKYGSLDGLHERLDAIRLARPKPFDPGRYSPADGEVHGKTVLAELFTGAECGPCIAADIALNAVSDYYNRDTVTVLEYHMHAPGPDPLTNPDTERRADYYGVMGTPTALIDGTHPQYGGGSASLSRRVFEAYKSKIGPRLRVPLAAEFKKLELNVASDTVRVSGTVLQPGAGQRTLHLRIALAEEVVHYTGGNGIHFHHFVVRKFLGSPGGLDVGAGSREFTFSESASIRSITGGLAEYLRHYESEAAGGWPGFDEKPVSIDPGQLRAVAFLQDDETREILNSAFAK